MAEIYNTVARNVVRICVVSYQLKQAQVSLISDRLQLRLCDLIAAAFDYKNSSGDEIANVNFYALSAESYPNSLK